MQLRVLKKFLPEIVSLDGLSKLNEDARLRGLTWWKPSATAALALSRGMYRIVASNYNGFASLLRYGYVFINHEYFLEIIAGAWEMICEDVLRVIPGATLPSSAADLFDALLAFQPTLWPLFPGPIVRRAGASVWIDVIACTAVLERSLEFPIIDGDAGNARADHFEGTTQQTINATPWAPGLEIAQMIGKNIKKADGTILTNLDALGENGLRLLLVSCKSMVYSGRYDSGHYVAVRNIRTTAEEAVKWWSQVADYLEQNPIGPNYDFSKYQDIIPVVCTPQVVYVSSPDTLRSVETGLRSVCSLSELRTWLMKT
jgi:hypothetical protein